MTAETLISALVSGVLLGGLYAVVAVGLSLIFGIIRVINFAHGSLLMIFLYAGFWLWSLFKLDPYVSILIVAPLAFVSGYAVQHILIRPIFVREKAFVVEPLGVLLLMAGLDMVLTNGALLFFRSDSRAVLVSYGQATIPVGFLNLSVTRLALLGIAVLIVVGLHWMLRRTEVGTIIRAVGQNREAAALCGVNIHRIYAFTFGLGVAVLGVGASAMLPFYFVEPSMGLPLGVKSFIIVVLGGLGSVPGALLGALIIGVVESVGAQFVPATAASIFSLLLFLAILFLRPKGLLGVLEA